MGIYERQGHFWTQTFQINAEQFFLCVVIYSVLTSNFFFDTDYDNNDYDNDDYDNDDYDNDDYD